MRISTQSTVDTTQIVKNTQQTVPLEKVVGQVNTVENNEVAKEKLQQAVSSMNDLLKTNHSSSKFVYHEGLDRYYVTVVDEETDRVIKEIPPKKLLDAFYEMQKLVGMIVDEKI